MNVVFENIPAFLAWLGSSPGIVAILSFVAERWPWYQAQSSKAKQAIAWAVAFILPQISLALLEVVPPEIWGQLQPRFQAILTSVSVIATLFISEAVHEVDKRVSARK